MPRSKDKSARTHGKAPTSGRSKTRRFVRVLFLVLDVTIIAGLLASGYSGCFSPLKYGGGWGIIGLTFPFFLIAATVLLVLQCIWYRPGAAITLLGMICCSGPIFTYFPVNIAANDRKPSQPDARTFTLMAYNTANILDQRPAGSYDSSYSQMVSYIIERQPDIVCLSEARELCVGTRTHITAAQMDSLHRIYPHIILSGAAQTTLCKFPIEPIHININDDTFKGGDLGVYRVTLPGGKLLTLFNLHLQSLGLNDDDKNLYLDLTEMRPEDFETVKSQLLSKIARANVRRARQVNMLLGLIRHFGGPNVIVCGDFNDIPGCFTIRALGTAGFRSVYPQLGFGPMITFNANRFYFCIDHILYRGDLRPLSIHKGSLRASDHYPLNATFEIDD